MKLYTVSEHPVYWCEKHGQVLEEPCCEGLKPMGTIWTREGENK